MENILRYSSPASCFEEALPIGNGSIGAMVYGRCDKERLSLNHDTLWSGNPSQVTRPKAYEAYKKAQKLMLEDKPEEATLILEKDFTGPFGQSYLPLGNLYIESACSGEVSDYIRTLDMEKGTVTVEYAQNGIHFFREYFVSYPDGCIALRITSDKPASYIFSADSQLKSICTSYGKCIYLTGECPVSISPSYARGTVPTVYDGNGIKFAAVGSVSANGETESDEVRLTVKDATETVFVMCIDTSYISFDKMPLKPHYYQCEKRVSEIYAIPYAELLSRHIKDHASLYGRVKLDLGFPASDKTTDARIREENKDGDLGLAELLFNFGRYLIIASSREGSEAANLQGIWNEELFAPWSSNYTVNINTEMNYWPVLPCGLSGLDRPIIDLAKKISVTGAQTAKDFYGAKGYCAHHNIDLWGLSTPVGAGGKGCLCYAYWNMSSGWLCRHLWEHYEYTLDEAFLRDTAYPLMKDAAEFYLDIMIKDGDRYVICPSTSPENSYYAESGERIAIARHTAMTQGILIDLFGNIAKAAEILGINDSFTEEIQQKLPFLNTYAIGSEGQLLEFDKEYKETDVLHRHTSHLYGLYPGESITAESTPELAEACRRTLVKRGDISTGWSMGWRVCLWAKLKDGDHALKLVKNQLRYAAPSKGKISMKSGGTYANLFDAHPPFQIDGNFGVCAGIALMLLQCEDGKIRLLPALPSAFKRGSVSGLKAKGNITVGIVWENNALTEFTLTSPVAQSVTVSTQYGEKTLELAPNKTITVKNTDI